MHAVLCKVKVVTPYEQTRKLFTRRKARGWAMTMGKAHIEAGQCSHPECTKVRSYFKRDILYYDKWDTIRMVPVGSVPAIYLLNMAYMLPATKKASLGITNA